MAIILLRVASCFYALAAIATTVHVLRPRETGERRALLAVFVALLAHAIAVGGRTVEMGAFPMAGVSDALSLFGFISCLIAVAVSVRGGVPQVTWLATPLVTLLVIIGAISEPSTHVPEALRSMWLSVHISLALVGDAAFVVAGMVAVVYLIQENRLKHRKKRRKRGDRGTVPPPPRSSSDRTAKHNLPALEALDSVSMLLFKVGFPLMTLGIITGIFYGKRVLDVYWTWDARNTVSALVWILYAAMLNARVVIGWRGRKAAILTVVGVVVILLTFVGLGLTSSAMHRGTGMS